MYLLSIIVKVLLYIGTFDTARWLPTIQATEVGRIVVISNYVSRPERVNDESAAAFHFCPHLTQ